MSKPPNKECVTFKRRELQRFILGIAVKHYCTPKQNPNISATIESVIEHKYVNMDKKERDEYVAIGLKWELNQKQLNTEK